MWNEILRDICLCLNMDLYQDRKYRSELQALSDKAGRRERITDRELARLKEIYEDLSRNA